MKLFTVLLLSVALSSLSYATTSTPSLYHQLQADAHLFNRSSSSQNAPVGSTHLPRQLGEEITHKYLKFAFAWGPGYCLFISCVFTPWEFFGTALRQEGGEDRPIGPTSYSPYVVLGMSKDIITFMPDVYSTEGFVNVSYYESVYYEYGVYCSEVRSASDYFQLIIHFTRLHNLGLLDKLRQKGIMPGRKKHSLHAMHIAIHEYFGFRGEVRTKIGGRKSFLSEIGVCTDVRGERMIDCKSADTIVNDEIYFPMPIR